MVQGEDTIAALIEFKADFGKATKSLEEYLATTTSKVNALESKLANMLGQKSKTSKTLINNYKEELDILYKQQAITQQQLKVQKQRDSYQVERTNMLARNMENSIKLDEISGKKFSNNLKSQITESQAYNQRILGFNNILDSAKQKSADNEIKTAEATSKIKTAIAREEFLTRQKMEESDAKAMTARQNREKQSTDRAKAKTWEGALTGGTSIGHKAITTAQYAAVGTAIYAVAGAVTTLGQAALEADLNMRTMAAVLGLSINQAKELDKSVRDLGETYGGTTTEIEKVALALGRAGVETQDITKATEITLKMARLTGDTFEQSANAVISFQQVFGNTTSLETLGNKLAYVANQSRLSTQDIGTLSNYALAAAKDVGLTEDAVGGLAAAFSNAGVNASTIGTQIRRFTTLLTDNSEAVTSFFNEAGVSQSKLALQISRGGKDSNEAMMKFAKTLQSMDSQSFTKLTGQMDILAANSLALIRNNADNINTYMSDLQKGLSTQLDSVGTIVDATKVKIETLWNAISNSAINSINNTVEWWDLRIDGMYYSWLDLGLKMNKASQEIFTFSLADTSDMDKRIEKNTDLYNITQLQLKLKAAERRNDQVEMLSIQAKIKSDGKRLGIVKDTSKIMDGNTLRDNENTEGLKKRLEYLNKNKNTLSDVEKIELELVQNTVKSNEAKQKNIALEKEKDATLKGTFVSTKASYEQSIKLATSELGLNESLSASTKKLYDDRKAAYNAELIDTYKTKVKETSTATQNMLANVNFASVDAATAIEGISGKLREQINITKDESTKKLYADDLAVLSDMQKVHTDIMDVKREENNFDSKIEGIKEKNARKAQEAADKALRAKEKEVNLGDRNEKALASIAELQAQLTGEAELTLGKAESKFYVDTQLVGLAYDQYIAAKGTRQEKEKEALFNEATVTYLKSSLGYVNKISEEEDKRKVLNLELNSSLDQSLETEEVRLGVIEKGTDSEYEKLRVKIEQAKIDKTLTEAEIAGLEMKLIKLKQYQNQKKTVHTLAMEYQRQISEQETAGYIAAKAGLESLESGMSNFFDVTSDGWLEWHSLATSVLNSIYKQLLEQLVIKQLVSGLAGGISSGFGNVGTAMSYGTNIGSQQTAMLAAQDADFKVGGMIPTKGYASGGMLSGGTGIRDDIYLGNVGGTSVFAMGGEFITRKSSVNDETKGTLDYINKTGTTPSSNAQVNVPVKINIENNTGQAISADMIEAMTKPNDKGEYEKVINIVLKASRDDPRMRGLLKGGR